jgi:hypothetical protein
MIKYKKSALIVMRDDKIIRLTPAGVARKCQIEGNIHSTKGKTLLIPGNCDCKLQKEELLFN